MAWDGGHENVVLFGFELTRSSTCASGGPASGEQLDQQRGPRGPKNHNIPRIRGAMYIIVSTYMDDLLLVNFSSQTTVSEASERIRTT